ncbi:transposase [uncultured Succinivibrio sp.]|uniref:IS66 family transposase n=1 Tax=uncultured Succinivibrio sp. TaxID=540749 RepID=UPI003459B7E8
MFNSYELKSENSPLKYLISDGYAGYDSAIKVLNEQGVTLKSCRCYAHARRPLHYYLKNTGLLKIYHTQDLKQFYKRSLVG